jgi:signal transduction histidine kinase/CheY-like chemotaxis protein/ligand-binding sensor domain-containing protein
MRKTKTFPFILVALLLRLAALLLCVSVPSHAFSRLLDSDNFSVIKFNVPPVHTKSGLMEIARSQDGFIYLATLNGLLQWDGTTFTSYTTVNTPGLWNDQIRNLYVTKSNDLWLFRSQNTVTRKSGDHFETFTIPSQSNTIHNFAIGHNEEPWVLTEEHLYVFDYHKQTFDQYPYQAVIGKTYLLHEQDDGVIYFITESGLWRHKNQNLTHILPALSLPVDLTSLLSMYIHEDKTALIGFLGGYVAIDIPSGREIIRNLGNVTGVLRFLPHADKKLIGLSREGSFHINPDTWLVTFNRSHVSSYHNNLLRLKRWAHLPDNTLAYIEGNQIVIGDFTSIDSINEPHVIYADANNNIWVGNIFGEIFRIRQNEVQNIHKTDAGIIQNVYSILEDSNQGMWYGCLLNGIFYDNGNEVRSWNTQNSSLPSNHVWYLFQDPSDKTIYASIYHEGLWRLEQNRWRPYDEINQLYSYKTAVIEAMYYDPHRNRLFAGSSEGVMVREHDAWGIYKPQSTESPRNTRVIRETSKNELLFGSSSDGIMMVDANDDIIWISKVNDGLSSNSIRDIYVQSDDTIWVATQNNGINRLILSEDRKIKTINSLGLSDGLPNLMTHRLLKDGRGSLWLSTNYGIISFNLKQVNNYLDGRNDQLHIQYFDMFSGMLHPEANGGVENAGTLRSDGTIIFPTQRGAVLIDPEFIFSSRPTNHPLPIIRHIETNSRQIRTSHTESLVLNLGERNFTAYFQVPAFNNSIYRTIRYRLDGVDTAWLPVRDTYQTRYSSLKPGRYTLHIQILTPDSDPQHTQLAIIVPSFLYERLWFQLLTAFIVLGITGYVSRYVYNKKIEVSEIKHLVDLQTKELQHLNEEKSRFFTGITHEFKTPISIIMGNVEKLLHQAQEATQAHETGPLKSIQRNSYKILFLIDALLEIAKVQNNRFKLNLSTVGLVQLSQLYVQEISDLLSEKNLRVKWIIPEHEIFTDLDLDAWERIIINLMSNAIYFSPVNGTIWLEFYQNDQNILFQITDEGPGLGEKDSKDIFDYMKQGGKSNPSGSGIGLFLVRELVMQHHGSITVINKTNEQRGACLQITLPLSDQHTPTVTIVQSDNTGFLLVHDSNNPPESISDSGTYDESILPVSIPQKGSIHLLLVEDNVDYLNLIASELSPMFKVTALNSAKIALERLTVIKPDLIISDIMMPEMSGLSFVSKIRSNKSYSSIPVIFLSSLASENDVQSGLSAGADVFLTKPVKTQILKAQIQALLRREHNLAELMLHSLDQPHNEFEARIVELIYRHMGNSNLNVDMIADSLFISRSTLYRKWGELHQISLQNYITKFRLNEAIILIREKKFLVSEAALAVGFSDVRYFSTLFKKEFGFSPSTLLKD